MSWLALDARCRAHERAGWQQWEHTRLLVAAWTGQKPGDVIPLPSDAARTKAPAALPSPEFIEQLRLRAAAHTTT